MAMISALAPVVCGKYEVAIVLPEDDDEGSRLLGIAIRTAGSIALAVLLFLAFLGDRLLSALRADDLGGWVFLLPPAVLTMGVGTAMSYFANRHGHYVRMARGQMINSLSVAVVSLALGFLGVGFGGLIIGWMAGSLASVVYLVGAYRHEVSTDVIGWSPSHRELMKRYSDFPIFNASSGLLNGVTSSLPTFYLNYFFSGGVVGHFSVLIRLVQTPLALLTKSVSQVNLKKVADLSNAGQPVTPYLLKATLALVSVVALPSIVAILLAPEIFALIFGAEWREAGVYLQILMPAFAIRFVASTLSSTIGATQHNRLGALWRVIALVATLAVYSIVAPSGDVMALFRVVVFVDAGLYTLYYAFIWTAASNVQNGARAA